MSSGFDASWLRTDGGSNWLPKLTTGLPAVEAVLTESEAVGYLEAPEGEALLAAVCVLGLVGRDLPVPCPPEVRNFLQGLDEPISEDLTDRAVAALEVVVDPDRSELAELFGEHEESSRSFEGRVEALKSVVLERRNPVSIPDLAKPEPGDVFGIPLPDDAGWALGVVGQCDRLSMTYYLLGTVFESLPATVDDLVPSMVISWRSTAVTPVADGSWPLCGAVAELDPGASWPELIWVNDYSASMDSPKPPPSPAQLFRFEKRRGRLTEVKDWVDSSHLERFPRPVGGGFAGEGRRIANLLDRVRAGNGESETDWIYPGYEHATKS